MEGKALYLAKNWFKNGELFYINRINEADCHHLIYHSHDFIEINYVVSGKGIHIIDGRRYQVSKGDLFVINTKRYHAFYREADGVLCTYNILFRPDFLDSALIDTESFNGILLSYLFRGNDGFGHNGFMREYITLDGEEQADYELLIDKMYREYSQRKPGFQSILRAYLIELLVKIIRNDSTAYHEALTRGKDAVIERVIRYIHQNYNKSIRLGQLSDMCYVSKNYFCKLFKEYTGTTLSDYIQLLRIDNACRMLDKTNKKIVDIALEVGFCDYKSFSAAFKKTKGMKPSEYKKKSHPAPGAIRDGGRPQPFVLQSVGRR